MTMARGMTHRADSSSGVLAEQESSVKVSAAPEDRTLHIVVSPEKAQADLPALVPASLRSDMHRIAPHEELVLDAAMLRDRFAETDDARIEAALVAHNLHEAPGSPSPAPSATSRSMVKTAFYVAALGAAGLLLGILGALVGG